MLQRLHYKRVVIYYMCKDLNASLWQKILFWLTPREKLAKMYTDFLVQQYAAYMNEIQNNPKQD